MRGETPGQVAFRGECSQVSERGMTEPGLQAGRQAGAHPFMGSDACKTSSPHGLTRSQPIRVAGDGI